MSSASSIGYVGGSGGSHLIPYPPAPFDHLRYRILIQAPAGLANGVHYSEITLQGVKSCDGILKILVSKTYNPGVGNVLTPYARPILLVLTEKRRAV